MDIGGRAMKTTCTDRKIAVMGGGSWATALAKLLLENCREVIWYMRRDDRIEAFKRRGRNPAYLSDVEFPVERINFYSDINEACRAADTLLMAMPSPYFKAHLRHIGQGYRHSHQRHRA